MQIERTVDSAGAVFPGGYRKQALVWGAVLFGGWSLTMLFTAVMAVFLAQVSSGDAAIAIGPILVGPAGFSPFGFLGAYLLLWGLSGTESVRRTPDSLVTRSFLLGIPISTREYAANEVKRLRYSPLPYMRPWNLWAAILGGSVALDYGAMTFRFGIGLSEDDASEVLSAIAGAE